MSLDEIEMIDGGAFNAQRFMWGTIGAMFGAACTVAGLGTPISIGGAVLAAGSASMVAASF
jgi:hypothetical protein